jgi:regulator of replication initiation timing
MDSKQEYQVVMSPLLSSRIEQLEEQVKNLDSKLDLVLEHIDTQTKDFNRLLEENIGLLQENRKLYLEALDKIQQTEEREVKPMLKELYDAKSKLFLNSGLLEARILNRSWRNNYKLRENGNITIPSQLGIVSILNKDNIKQ